jgi:membrane protease YdiL (CAAX protease family)
MAALVLRSGAVWPAVVAHSVFNLLGILLSNAGSAAGRGG